MLLRVHFFEDENLQCHVLSELHFCLHLLLLVTL